MASIDEGGPLTWLVGVFGFEEKSDQYRSLSLPSTGAGFEDFAGATVENEFEFTRTGFAAFSQVSYSITDQLDVTGGIRYSEEFVDFTIDKIVEIPLLPATITVFGNTDTDFSDVSPMGSISYRWNEDLMTYLTIAKGFKAGGYDGTTLEQSAYDVPFDSEESISYEVGFKGTLLDGGLDFSGAIYHIDLDDLQVLTSSLIDGIPIGIISNAGESRSRGAEAEFVYRPNANLLVSGSVSYTDAEFIEYIDANDIDQSGNPLNNVPEWTGSLQLEYLHPLSNGMDLSYLVSYSYIDEIRMGTGIDQDPVRQLDSYDVVDASISLDMDDLVITLFADNLLDDYNVPTSQLGFFNLRIFDQPQPPRRVGIRASYQW